MTSTLLGEEQGSVDSIEKSLNSKDLCMGIIFSVQIKKIRDLMVPVRYERLIRIPDDDHPPASKELDVSHSPQKCLRHLWLPHLQKSKISQNLCHIKTNQ